MSDAREAALRERLARAPLPVEAGAEVEGEWARLAEPGLPAAARATARAWLETVLALPWLAAGRPPPDVTAVRAALDREVLAQREAKERALEAVAAGALRADGRIPPLCLLGPPGVGKSHLVEVLARALGRPAVHVRLGGADPEAALVGRPRYTEGSGLGRVLAAIVRAGVPDPVLVLDGLDAALLEDAGDVTGALLPLLDPQECGAFADRWLGLPFDLSRALVICTAYVGEVLPLEVRDLLTFALLRGYTDEEKHAIARRHLLPRLCGAAGIDERDVLLSDATLEAVIDGWTFEPGVRVLSRRLMALLRALALRKAGGEQAPFSVTPEALGAVLGPRTRHRDHLERVCVPGVAMGLAWTPAGGQVLYIEASAVPGRGNLKLTGSLGDVMKESAEAATTWLREHAAKLGDVQALDIHVHVPEGAVPKDGPSAGIALLLAIVSAVTDRVLRPDVASTGEITLRGQVLPVGGIREKVMAAHQAGIRALILPRRNEEDLAEVPPEILAQMDLHFIDRVEEALGTAFAVAPARASKAPRGGGPGGGPGAPAARAGAGRTPRAPRAPTKRRRTR